MTVASDLQFMFRTSPFFSWLSRVGGRSRTDNVSRDCRMLEAQRESISWNIARASMRQQLLLLLKRADSKHVHSCRDICTRRSFVRFFNYPFRLRSSYFSLILL